jgi:hypothetical protein
MAAATSPAGVATPVVATSPDGAETSVVATSPAGKAVERRKFKVAAVSGKALPEAAAEHRKFKVVANSAAVILVAERPRHKDRAVADSVAARTLAVAASGKALPEAAVEHHSNTLLKVQPSAALFAALAAEGSVSAEAKPLPVAVTSAEAVEATLVEELRPSPVVAAAATAAVVEVVVATTAVVAAATDITVKRARGEVRAST